MPRFKSGDIVKDGSLFYMIVKFDETSAWKDKYYVYDFQKNRVIPNIVNLDGFLSNFEQIEICEIWGISKYEKL